MHNLFELNPNILETNLINIFLLIGILLYANKVSFSKTLEDRKNEIAKDIEKAEKNLSLIEKFSENIEEDLKLNFVYLSEWKANYEKEKKETLKIKYQSLQNKLEQIFSITEDLLENFSKKTVSNLEKYVVLFIVGKLLRKFFFLSKEKKSKIVNQIILNLQEPSQDEKN